MQIDKRKSAKVNNSTIEKLLMEVQQANRIIDEYEAYIAEIESKYEKVKREKKELEQKLAKNENYITKEINKLEKNLSKNSELLELFDEIPGKNHTKFEYLDFFINLLIPLISNSLRTNQFKIFRGWLLDLVLDALDLSVIINEILKLKNEGYQGDNLLNELLRQQSGLRVPGKEELRGNEWREALEALLVQHNIDFTTAFREVNSAKCDDLYFKGVLSLYHCKNFFSRDGVKDEERKLYYDMETVFRYCNLKE